MAKSELSGLVGWKLMKAVRGRPKRSTQNEGTATLVRRDQNGTAYVRIPGSSIDTPVNGSETSSAMPGESVRYSINGGRLSITGNTSSPSVGGSYVKGQVTPVLDVAKDAIDQSAIARSAAESAVHDADVAHGAALDAQGQAVIANTAAQGALLGLSTVEDVVDVVEWLTAHSKATEDTSIDYDKAYYTRDATTGAMTRAMADPSESGWVEAAASADTEAVDGKTYYELDAQTGELTPVTSVPSGANPSELGWLEVTASTDTSMVDGKEYYTVDAETGVASPVSPASMGWWEMDDAVARYIASHLAMTDNGLNVMVDGHRGYIHLGTFDGTHEYGTYIVGDDGVPEANFGEHTRVGREGGMHIDITSDATASGGRLFSIADGKSDPVMYVQVVNGESLVYMTNAVVVSDLRFGDWTWYERANGNMSVRWTGGN